MADVDAQLRRRAERGSQRGADAVWDGAVRMASARARRRRVRVAVPTTIVLALAGGSVGLWSSERDDGDVVADAPSAEQEERAIPTPAEVIEGAVVARANGLFRIENGDAVRLLGDDVRLGFALGDDRIVFQRPDPATYCPSPTSEPIEVLEAGERREVAAVGEGEGATLTLLDGGFVEGRAVAVAVRGIGPCSPETSSERLVLIDVDTNEETDLGATGGWEFGVREARLTNAGVVLYSFESIQNKLELRGFDGTTVWARELTADTRLSIVASGTEVLVLQPLFEGAAFEPTLRIERVDLVSGARVRSSDLQLRPVAPLSIESGFCAHADGRDGILVCDRTAGWPMTVDVESGAAEAIEALDSGTVTLQRTDALDELEDRVGEAEQLREQMERERQDRLRRTTALASMTGGPEQVLVGGTVGLALLDASTGEQLALLDDLSRVAGPARVGDVALGPDQTIWYTVASENEYASLWRLSADEPEPAQVVARGYSPAPSPDGRFLAYIAADESSPSSDPSNVLVVRDLIDGTERRIGGLVAPDRDAPSTPLLTDLAWHPDGDRIAFSFSYGFEREENQIAVLDLAAHRTLADATALPGNLTSPSWTDDGVLFAVELFAEFAGRVPVVRFDDLTAEPIRDVRFGLLGVVDIVAGANVDQVLVRTAEHDVIFALVPGGEPRLIAQYWPAIDW